MNPAKEKMLAQALFLLMISEIGRERTESLLRQLAKLEDRTGAVLRRSPRGSERHGRGDDETSPWLLFAPDRDRDSREFFSISGRDLLYGDRNDGRVIPYRYRLFSDHDVRWWKELNNKQKGIVISALEHALCALGRDGRMADLMQQMGRMHVADRLETRAENCVQIRSR